ncbi:MAG TPA: TolC family protein [Bacteroidales bacterium]|nr:TolC family protein [Bacteroidales bacterium]
MKRIACLTLLALLACVLLQGQVKSLQQFINDGLARSPLLKDLSNQVASLAYDSALVRALRKPQIEARSVLQYIPVYSGFGYDEVVTDHGNYQGAVGLSQDIFRRKETGNRLQAVNIERKSINNTSKISANELTKLITEQYLLALSAYNDYTFNSSFLVLLNTENEIVKQLASKGVYRQTDYISLLVETQTQGILVKQMRNDYSGSLKQLNALCGINDTSSIELIMPELSVKGSPDFLNSPSYRQYEIDSLRIANEKSAVDIRYRPKVSWFADAGFLSHDLMSFYSHFGYSAGISLSLPIYDGNQRKLEKQKLEIEENSRGNYRNNFRVKYIMETSRLTDEMNSEKSILSDLESQLKTSGELLRTLKSELESGLIQMTEYLVAVRNHRLINKSLSDSRIRILQIITELNYIINQ